MFFLVAVGLVGLVFGSFFNVCIGRLPAGESVITPGSRCPVCRKPIGWYDNIPVASYLVLGGKCRVCRAPISVRYPLTEIVTAVAFVVQAMVAGADLPVLAVRLVFTSLLIVLFGTDLETQRLPNVLTYPGIVIGLVASVWLPPGFTDAAIGAALGAGVLLAVRWGWKRATGVDGMGLGDVKMLAMIGAFLGWEQVFIVLFFASLVGAVVGILLTVAGKRSLQSRLPFGTFLAVAAYLASLYGERVVEWYGGMYR